MDLPSDFLHVSCNETKTVSADTPVKEKESKQKKNAGKKDVDGQMNLFNLFS